MFTLGLHSKSGKNILIKKNFQHQNNSSNVMLVITYTIVFVKYSIFLFSKFSIIFNMTIIAALGLLSKRLSKMYLFPVKIGYLI